MTFKPWLEKLKPINLISHRPRPGWALLDQQGCAWELDAQTKRELVEAAIAAPWNPYPEQHMGLFKQKILAELGLDAGVAQVCIGNGSMELLSNLFLSCARPSMLYIEPGFFGYPRLAQMHNYEVFPHSIDGLRGDRFYVDVDRLCQAVLRHGPGLVLLHLPHSPTGVTVSTTELAPVFAAAEQVGALVVLDQVYLDPLSRDELEPLSRPNVIINRAFGKMWSLSGIRCGFMLGPPALIAVLESVRLPFSVNTLTQAIMLGLLQRPEVLAQLRVRRDADTAAFHARLATHPLVTRTYPSKASFLLFESRLEPEYLYQEMQARQVGIRRLQHPGWGWALSATAAESSTNQRFFDALDDIGRAAPQ